MREGGGENSNFFKIIIFHKNYRLFSNNYNILTNPKLLLVTTYSEMITLKNIIIAFNSFIHRKSKRKDVNLFYFKYIDELFNLFDELKNFSYKHGPYTNFKIIDTKTRLINKANVIDRIVHRLVYNFLYNYFDKRFIYDSYSSRKYKGTHKAILRYEDFSRKITNNYTKQAFVLKFDIKKCFQSIDQDILMKILSKYILDKDILSLCKEIVFSHKSGLALGNLTSQLFINIYLNELDFFAKKVCKIQYYIRYADDIVCFFKTKKEAEEFQFILKSFCLEHLNIIVHKEVIRTVYSGMDFLGFINFPKYRILRKITKNKMLKNINENNKSSYNGLLKWGNCHKIKSSLYLD